MTERREGDRRAADLQLGELIGTITAMKTAFVEIKEEMAATKTLVLELQTDVALKFRTAETVFKTLKILGLIIGALLTFKFGDIKTLWSAFFS